MAPLLRPVSRTDLDYRRHLVDRFFDPDIRDTLARPLRRDLALTKWLLRVARENLAADGEVRRSAAVVVGRARYPEGVDQDAQPIEIADCRRNTLAARARRSRGDPLAFIAERELFGDLVNDEHFTLPGLAALTFLCGRGVRATLQVLVNDAGLTPSASAQDRARRITRS